MITFISSMVMVSAAIFAGALVVFGAVMFVQKTNEMTKDDHSKN